MVAKTFQGLEDVLADELRALGAQNVTPGRRMVAFEGDKELMYRANLSCRTALRILKPIVKFTAGDPDTLYEMTKEYDWSTLLSPDKTFSIDSVVNSDLFNHSRYVTYRVKDGIVDFFKDRYGADKRPGVRLQDADVMINVHIDGNRVTLSLDSSGESLHKRGYRVAQTEAPINEVLAAGILMKAGYNGSCPLVDPMCGSGTFLIEAALIAANINPGVYRRNFAFEQWKDFDEELFESLYNDDSNEREPEFKIYGADISPKAIAIAEKNIKQAGVGKYIDLEIKPLSKWEESPAEGIIVTNPPYGERISVEDMDGLYELIGSKLKKVFKGYHAWIIGYQDDYFKKIGLAPSQKLPMLNGSLECELREYVIFEGDYKSFRREGNTLHTRQEEREERGKKKESRRISDEEWRNNARKKGFGGKDGDREEKRRGGDFKKKRSALEEKYKAKPVGKARRKEREERENRFRDDRKREFRPENGRKKDFRDNNRREFNRDTTRKEFTRDNTRRDNDAPETVSENPLAVRRNEKALKMIQGKQPSIPLMRSRKGWKRGEADNNDNNND
ncbi:MAG: RNA methyltransferase [Muribaculum sp.]|nr:RNA methyltransferase [Muribaculum sp.]